MQPAYRIGTTLAQVIVDGWARGLEVNQTIKEAASIGLAVTKPEVLDAWNRMDQEYREYCLREVKEGTR